MIEQVESDLLERYNLVVGVIHQLTSRIGQLEATITDEREFLAKLQALGGPWLLHDQRIAALEVRDTWSEADRQQVRVLAEAIADHPMDNQSPHGRD